MDHITLLLLDGTVSKDLYGELGNLNLLNAFFYDVLVDFQKKGQSKNVLFFSLLRTFHSV